MYKKILIEILIKQKYKVVVITATFWNETLLYKE